jgi:hypothetical protein
MARAPRLYPLVSTLHPLDAHCLFAGRIAEPLRSASPFLFPVAASARILDLWSNEGEGQSWGIFMTSPLGLEEVRRHVRKFLQVRLPDGSGPVLFRFWDPRVFHPFLISSPPDHLAALFAKVSSYLVETPAGMQRFYLDGERLRSVAAGWGDIRAK